MNPQEGNKLESLLGNLEREMKYGSMNSFINETKQTIHEYVTELCNSYYEYGREEGYDIGKYEREGAPF